MNWYNKIILTSAESAESAEKELKFVPRDRITELLDESIDSNPNSLIAETDDWPLEFGGITFDTYRELYNSIEYSACFINPNELANALSDIMDAAMKNQLPLLADSSLCLLAARKPQVPVEKLLEVFEFLKDHDDMDDMSSSLSKLSGAIVQNPSFPVSVLEDLLLEYKVGYVGSKQMPAMVMKASYNPKVSEGVKLLWKYTSFNSVPLCNRNLPAISKFIMEVQNDPQEFSRRFGKLFAHMWKKHDFMKVVNTQEMEMLIHAALKHENLDYVTTISEEFFDQLRMTPADRALVINIKDSEKAAMELVKQRGKQLSTGIPEESQESEQDVNDEDAMRNMLGV